MKMMSSMRGKSLISGQANGVASGAFLAGESHFSKEKISPYRD